MNLRGDFSTEAASVRIFMCADGSVCVHELLCGNCLPLHRIIVGLNGCNVPLTFHDKGRSGVKASIVRSL